MKIIIDVDNLGKAPKENDLIVFNGLKWVCISRKAYFNEEIKKMELLEKSDADLKKEIETLKGFINDLAKVIKGGL